MPTISAVVLWMLVSTTWPTSSATTRLGLFQTEAQCEAAAAELIARARARQIDRNRWLSTRQDALCIPVQGLAQP